MKCIIFDNLFSFQIHEHAPYFVDALWDYTPVLKVIMLNYSCVRYLCHQNWQAMTQLLLDEPSCSMLTLGDEEETALVEIMCCAIQRAIGTNSAPGRGKPRVCYLHHFTSQLPRCRLARATKSTCNQ